MIDSSSIQAYFPEGVVILDLETTGLSAFSDHIIEIGALKIDSKGNVHHFQSLINPEIPLSESNTKIHGITDSMVANAPYIDQILPKFLLFMENLPIVAHNAKYDVGFLFIALMRHRYDIPTVDVFDSCKVAKLAYPKLPHHNLAFLTNFLNIDLKNKHRAYADAHATTILLNLSLNKITQDARPMKVKEDALIYSLDKLRKSDFKDMPAHIIPIIPRITHQEIIEIKYTAGHHRGVFRPIKLLGLIPVPYGYSIMALCLFSNLNKSFLVSKISNYRFLTPEEQSALHEKIH